MTLIPGTTLGPYEIQSALGAGGMGEVYKAMDARLGRIVAIKVLPAAMTGDPQRRERFDREARLVSSLNHPHICALYDVGRHDGLDFLVMEYLDGETLADRLTRAQIPGKETLSIARQIAEALEAAHDKGIVHRDLKPSNVMITADGHVKVLDFGLATHADAGTRPDVSNSPTLMVTGAGVILGTAAYMSPEQANGKEADRSSDVWAFGCVFFEMLTDHRAFDGNTVSEIIANVLKSEPAWHRLPAATPSGVSRLLLLSLQKDRRLRLRDIRDWRLELTDGHGAMPFHQLAIAPSRRRERLAWASALVVVALIAGGLGLRAFRPAAIAPEVRLAINTPPTGNASVAISPDGQRLVFVAESAGQPQLWLRSLDSDVARVLPGTEHASTPFWSPDSRSIGFVADNRLKRVDLDGGSARTLASGIPVALGGGWTSDGTIVFGNNPGGPIFRVPAEGGNVVAATRVGAPQQRGHMFPSFLPDGRHFVFYAIGSPEAQGVYLGQLDSLESTRLIAADGPPIYAVRHLFFLRDGRLMAQPFDPDRLVLEGDADAVADIAARTAISVSINGAIVYRTPAPDSGQRQIVWVDRTGRETDRVVYADSSALGASLSHDGRRVAVYEAQNGNMDIWSFDTSRRAWDRLTFHPGDDIYPIWSRDGTSFITGSVRTSTVVDLYRTFLTGQQGREELLLASTLPKFPMDWSADERFLLYDVLDPKHGFDIWALPLDGQRMPFAVVETDFNEGLAQFSPDGRWIAYQSDRTGRTEIYLRPFRGSGADVRVSVNGGAQVRWNPNAMELFYVTTDSRLMAVPIRFSTDGSSAEPGTPRELFKTILSGAAGPTYKQQYMVSPDGTSFLMQSAVGEPSASPIGVILNWRPRGAK